LGKGRARISRIRRRPMVDDGGIEKLDIRIEYCVP
jgi:hypothetical protein